MLYVKRNESGSIVAAYREQHPDATEHLRLDHPDLAAFLIGPDSDPDPDSHWIRNDLSMARVLEDLIDVLIEKNVIAFTDLPMDAQKKVIGRHGKRDDLDYVARLFPISEDDELGE